SSNSINTVGTSCSIVVICCGSLCSCVGFCPLVLSCSFISATRQFSCVVPLYSSVLSSPITVTREPFFMYCASAAPRLPHNAHLTHRVCSRSPNPLVAATLKFKTSVPPACLSSASRPTLPLTVT